MTARPPHAFLPLALAAGTVLLATAACGTGGAPTPSATGPAGSSAGAGVPSAPSVSPTAAPSGPATGSPGAGSSPGSSAGTGGDRCAVGDLRIRYADDQGGGGAGSVTGTLTFTNTGSTACTLSGFPGVSYVGGGNGTQVGQAATRTDDAVRTERLAPGRSVTASLRRTQPRNYGEECQETGVDGLRVYPPDSTEAAFVALKTTGCRSTGAPLLQVGPVG